MPAAALETGRSRAGARSAPPRGRARSRGVASPVPPPSKLRAAQAVGLRAPAAGAAAALVALMVLAAGLATGGRGEQVLALGRAGGAAVASGLAAAPPLLAGGVESLGVKIREVHLQGASSAAQGEILAAAAVRPGQSLTALDLAAVRTRVEKVGWVARARVMRLWPGTIVIAVDQRPLVALWEHGGKVVVIASNGAVVGNVDPAHFTTLPLVVGDGANTAAAAILPSLSRRPRLWSRLRALVRVDDRRWNLQMADGGVILLPETDEEPALQRLDDLDKRIGVLGLGLERIDLRDPEMTIVRPKGASAPPAASGGA
ncbi:MAG TPA: cell division protein FtsQ/DivIB [Caulobacteraceae bacterium]|jgi:cell division protein FtsQ|nr:cell division protein FtsQ/DivIB [Caulobacteraceae bacterium]